jgi:uncharacterized phiE125 gp8 family phage protein
MQNSSTFLRYVRTSDAATEPINSTEFKAIARIDGTDEDTYIGTIITTARQMAEEYCQRSFITQTWKLYGNQWRQKFFLPRGKVISVTSIKYTDTAELDTTLSVNDYRASLQTDVGLIVPVDEWPETDPDFPNSFEITYTAGYGNAASVPEPIKQAIKLIAMDLYENRVTHSDKSVGTIGYMGKPSWQYILDPYRLL